MRWGRYIHLYLWIQIQKVLKGHRISGANTASSDLDDPGEIDTTWCRGSSTWRLECHGQQSKFTSYQAFLGLALLEWKTSISAPPCRTHGKHSSIVQPRPTPRWVRSRVKPGNWRIWPLQNGESDSTSIIHIDKYRIFVYPLCGQTHILYVN